MSCVSRLLKHSFMKNVLTLLSGTLIAQAVPVIISPLLTRIYTPEQFGVFALYVSIVSVLAVLATGRFELGIILPRDDGDAYHLLRLAIIIAIIFSASLLLIIFLSGYVISEVYDHYVWVWWIPLSVFISGLYQGLNYWISRLKQYKSLAYRNVWQSIITSIFTIIFGLTTLTAYGLILGWIIGQTLSVMLLTWHMNKQRNTDKVKFSYPAIRRLASEYKELPTYSAVSALFNSISVQVPVFMLTLFFGSTVSGQYSLSYRVLNMPMTLLGNSISQVFFQQASEINEDTEKLKTLTSMIFKRLFFTGSIPILLLIGFGDMMFALIFGEEWRTAGSYSRILGLWLLFVFVSSPLSNILTVLRKQKLAMWINVVLLCTRIASLWIGAVWLKDDFMAVLLFGGSGFLLWFLQTIYILKLTGVELRKPLLQVCIVLVFGLLVVGAVRSALDVI